MKIGPLMLDLEGFTLTKEEKQLLLNPIVGGVIYFARNYQSPEQMLLLSKEIKSLRRDLLIAIDQEGGRVQRIKAPLTRIPPMQVFSKLYQKNQESTVKFLADCGWLLASELKTMGIDFSFTPVLDIDDHFCDVISDRAFSKNPGDVTMMAGALIHGIHEVGMPVVGKHFPGHGGVKGDSHHVLPEDTRALSELEDHDLLPFMSLSEELDAVKPAHICFSKIDPLPVCFSPLWLNNLLRDEWGFKGGVFSDDLSMAGAVGMGTYPERAIKALDAGCDMVLVCNNREGALAVIETLSARAPHDDSVDLRLATMLAKPEELISLAELQDQPRWQRTSAMLSAIMPRE